MSMARRIEVQTAALTVAAGALFGMGESSPVVPAGLLLSAVLATRRVDDQPRFRLPAAAINGAIFVIALASAWRYAFAYGTGEVIVVGHATCALQAVLLFERRTPRTLWDLLCLSLLTVFLATSLPQGPLFAPALAGCVFLAFATLAPICIERERLRGLATASDAPAFLTLGQVRGSWWRLLGIAFSTLLVGPLALFLRFPERTATVAPPSESPTGPSAASAANPFAEAGCWEAGAARAAGGVALGREFWWRIGRMTVAAFVVAVAVFCVAPRFGRVEFELPTIQEIAWRGARPQPLRVAGFTDRVRLGELGTLSEDQRMVFELALLDGNLQAFRPRGDVYVRGVALTEYRGGHWEFEQGGASHERRWLSEAAGDSARAFMRQRITVEPSDRGEIFCVWPFLIIDEDPPVRYDSRHERLWRRRDMLGRSFTFDLATFAFQRNVQSELIPCGREIDPWALLRWPDHALPGLAGLARRWIDESEIAADDPIGRARWLQRRILESGQFRYSLQEKPRRAEADPIEDFVTRNPEGNCEYFASALALMLRAVGIPARLVVGFRAHDYSDWTQTYRVRQADAHAWVEAYIQPDRLPEALVRDDTVFNWSGGGWLRLDPTPSLTVASSGVARQVEDWLSLLHSFWRDHVVSMTATRQREAMYRPLVLQLRRAAAELSGTERETFGDAGLLAQVIVWGVGIALVSGGAAVGVWLFRDSWLAWRARRRGPRPARPRGAAPTPIAAAAFYARWEAFAARRGHVRAASQTPREFARQTAQSLAASSGERRIGQWADEIVGAFYEVRFRGNKLAAPRMARVEDAWRHLQRAVSSR